MNFNVKKRFNWLIMSGLFFVLSILPSNSVKAADASLYFSVPSDLYRIGDSFSINVFVKSNTQVINAVSGVINFPQDKLIVTAISKNGSIMSLWVQDPSYSNNTGTINFEGVVLNPGFIGTAGKIITINFRVKQAGHANIGFISGMALANDGKGTNILSSLGNISVTLTKTKVKNKVETKKIILPNNTRVQSVPEAATISSPTHPDSNKWYQVKTVTFKWQLLNGVTKVNILADKKADSNPGIESDGLMDSYTYNNVEDGIWYFHIRLGNKYGWGKVAHFRFQIDSQDPEPFNIEFIDGQETLNPRPTVLFNTTDKISGIDYYKIKIGDQNFVNLSSDKVNKNPYTLPPQKPGRHIMLVQAFDKAGNYFSNSAEFEIKALLTPIITDIPKVIESGNPIVIKGKTYADVEVTLWLQGTVGEAKAYKLSSNNNGDFIFVFDKGLTDGVYQLWAEIKNQQGSISNPTNKYIIVVKEPKFLKLGSDATLIMSIFVPLSALIILFSFILWFSWHKFIVFKKRINKRLDKTQINFILLDNLFKDECKKQLKDLIQVKKIRKLTREEQKLVKWFKYILNEINKRISKEIKVAKKNKDN